MPFISQPPGKRGESEKMKELAEKIYNAVCDMDFLDYDENRTEEIKKLIGELESLPDKSCLLSALTVIFE